MNGEGRDTYIANNNGGLNIPWEPQIIEIGKYFLFKELSVQNNNQEKLLQPYIQRQSITLQMVTVVTLTLFTMLEDWSLMELQETFTQDGL